MRSYVISICFSVILCVAADIIVPSQKYRGIVRIVCGIFVIGTIVSPIRNIINFDYSFSDSNIFLKDREEFFSKAAQSEEIYRNYLAKNGKAIAEEKINSEISEVFGENTVAKLGSDGLVVSGADASSKNDITEYVKKHYGIAVTYED